MTNLMPSCFETSVLMTMMICHIAFGESALGDAQHVDSVEQTNFNDHSHLADEGSSEANLAGQEDPSDTTADPVKRRQASELIHSPIAVDGLDELEPIRGDFDLDGVLDVNKDLHMLAKQVGMANPNLAYDLNGDGKVTRDDTRYWIEKIRGIKIGDANLDNHVNTSDINTVFAAAKYRTDDSATWETGDFDGDGKFDEADMSFMAQGGAYEKPVVRRRPATSTKVHEPILLSLVGIGLVFMLLTYTVIQGHKTVIHQTPSEH